MANLSALLKVDSDLKNLSVIRSFIEDAAARVGLSEEGVSKIRLAVDEACANIIQHGYGDNDGEIRLEAKQADGKLVVTLVDDAPPYNPLTETSAPDMSVPLEDRPLGGMGVLLVKQNTDAAEYRSTDSGGNALILTMHCPTN